MSMNQTPPTTANSLIVRFQEAWTDESSYLTEARCGYAAFEILKGARQILLDLQLTKDIGTTTTTTTNSNDRVTCTTLYQTADVLIDYAYEKLNAFPYREVPACWRELYTDASLLQAVALWLSCNDDCRRISKQQQQQQQGLLEEEQEVKYDNIPPESVETRRLAIRVLDKALVLAGACGPGRRALVMDAIEALEGEIASSTSNSGSNTSNISDLPPFKKLKMDHHPKEVEEGNTPPPPTSRRLGEEEDEESRQKRWPKLEFPIPRWHQPSLEEFARHVHQPNPTPVILTGAMDHWPALTKWTDLDRLCKAAGPDRLVPIEIGRQYTDEHWTQKLVTTREFIRQYILQPSASSSSTTSTSPSSQPALDTDADDADTNADANAAAVGYLAQHNLFEQIPRLRRDIDIPDYCCVGPAEDTARGYEPPDDTLLHAWFGPKGTVSPLHTDPYHNLLAQVVGYKYVRLYAPSQTPYLYSFGASHHGNDEDSTSGGGGGSSGSGDSIQSSEAEAMLLGNTSQVDIEKADLTQFPLFAQAEYVETVLRPGELLYIPLQWWHYIRSLSVSFSVSFWF
ncbi:hypothetical protein DFQ26_008198 [Actinomortierella ambigua]|nr:hypothetical protein DFQ26_008198 [Actinomortierella ambigua]